MVESDAAPGVHRLEDAHTNWLLVEQDDRLTLVDACAPAAWDSLGEAVRRIGRSLGDIDALVLTGHGPVWRDGAEEAVRRARAVGVA